MNLWRFEDGVLNDAGLISVAAQYFYAGDDAEDAAAVLRAWGYRVKRLGKR